MLKEQPMDMPTKQLTDMTTEQPTDMPTDRLKEQSIDMGYSKAKRNMLEMATLEGQASR